MAKSIGYLNYTVKRDGSTVMSGTVPAVIAFSGSVKNYDLGGIWLSHSKPNTEIAVSNGDKTINIYSDRVKTDWLEYVAKINSGEINDRR